MNLFSVNENYFVKRTKEEAKANNIPLTVINPMEVAIFPEGIKIDGKYIDASKTNYFRGSVEPFKREKITAVKTFLEKRGHKIINGAKGCETASNKWKTRQVLEASGISMPKACLAGNKEDLSAISETLKGFPLVAKSFYGCRGSGVIFIPDITVMKCVFDFYAALKTPFYFEEYIKGEKNFTTRIICIGGKAAATLAMEPDKDDFRSNSLKGGKNFKYEAGTEAIRAAEISVKACELDFASVDIIEIFNQTPKVLEVNSSPGIELAEQSSNKNIAAIFLNYCLTE